MKKYTTSIGERRLCHFGSEQFRPRTPEDAGRSPEQPKPTYELLREIKERTKAVSEHAARLEKQLRAKMDEDGPDKDKYQALHDTFVQRWEDLREKFTRDRATFYDEDDQHRQTWGTGLNDMRVRDFADQQLAFISQLDTALRSYENKYGLAPVVRAPAKPATPELRPEDADKVRTRFHNGVMYQEAGVRQSDGKMIWTRINSGGKSMRQLREEQQLDLAVQVAGQIRQQFDRMDGTHQEQCRAKAIAHHPQLNTYVYLAKYFGNLSADALKAFEESVNRGDKRTMDALGASTQHYDTGRRPSSYEISAYPAQNNRPTPRPRPQPQPRKNIGGKIGFDSRGWR